MAIRVGKRGAKAPRRKNAGRPGGCQGRPKAAKRRRSASAGGQNAIRGRRRQAAKLRAWAPFSHARGPARRLFRLSRKARETIAKNRAARRRKAEAKRGRETRVKQKADERGIRKTARKKETGAEAPEIGRLA
jgi:hypothetical protein